MFNHTAFDSIYRRALKQFPDAGEMRRQLPVPAEPGDLCQGSDAYYLSTMSRRVFRAGLRHAMVDERWPRFESAFAGFEQVMSAYEHAVAERYRFFSYGDAMLLKARLGPDSAGQG